MANEKFYKVIKENFVWEIGAIISHISGQERGYDLVYGFEVFAHPYGEDSVVKPDMVENNPEYFQRVYPVNLISKTVYKLKEQALEMMSEHFKGE